MSVTGISRRKETTPAEVDTLSSIVGFKQPRFAAHGRSGSVSCITYFCLAISCCISGMSLASVFYEYRLLNCGEQLRQGGWMARLSRVQTLRDIIDLKMPPDRLMERSDVTLCEGIPEPEHIEPVPRKIPFLMVIGTQKTGTTWLFRALTKHASFIPTIRRPGYDVAIENSDFQSKEPQHFNRWPMLSTEDYLHAWHSGVVGAMLSGAAGNRVLLDASPQYLMTAAAPARIKAAVPHAKFVVVIRDPPMRAFSDYVMMSRLKKPENNPSRLVPIGSFLEQIRSELDSPRRPECSFNSSASDRTTWFDCYKCAYPFIDVRLPAIRKACAPLQASGPPEFRNCSLPHFGFLEHGLYAPQLAWWLRFFEPEQFMIVSSSQLRDEVQQIEILNQIREHVGIGSSQIFTQEVINGTRGFNGNYPPAGNTSDDQEALRLLREYYRIPMEDLNALVATLYPRQNFTVGLES